MYITQCLILNAPILDWWIVRYGLKNGHPERTHVNKNWTTCSKLINHLNLKPTYSGRTLHDHVVSHYEQTLYSCRPLAKKGTRVSFFYHVVYKWRVATLPINKTFMWTPKFVKKMATRMTWICKPCCTTLISHLSTHFEPELLVRT